MLIDKLNLKKIFLLSSLFFALELVSGAGFFWPIINSIFFFVLVITIFIVSLKNLEYGLVFVLAELIVGSKGYLFFLPLGNGFLLSLRLVVWSVFMLIFFYHLIKQLYLKGLAAEYVQNIKNFIFLRPFIFLMITVFTGLISALIYGNSINNIFLDFNAWLYFLILLPLIAIRPARQNLINIFLAGTILISLKTLILLGLFSHNTEFSIFIYRWLRKTLVGEMTILDGWNRVFIQSQIFSAIIYLFILFKSLNFKKLAVIKTSSFWWHICLAGLFFSTIIISLSRSFWVALAGVLIMSIIFIYYKYSWQAAMRSVAFIFVSMILAFMMILIVIPFSSPGRLEDQLISRVSNQNEAAAVSRWSLLPVLFNEIKDAPIAGKGFGATVTYNSKDPRVLESNDAGVFTTYAFEWGYLDICLKLGFIGLFAYLWLLGYLIATSLRRGIKENSYFYLGLTVGLLFLAIVNIFTPYLNHPLGIGFLVVGACLISKNEVY